MNHPYYPPEAVIANYVPNSSPTLLIVSAFGAMAGLAVVAAYRLISANARFIDRFAASWFALSEWASFSFLLLLSLEEKFGHGNSMENLMLLSRWLLARGLRG